jgi:hypothetical protein
MYIFYPRHVTLEFTPGFSAVFVARSLVFCGSLFFILLLAFFILPLYCPFFDLRLLITPLVYFQASVEKHVHQA